MIAETSLRMFRLGCATICVALVAACGPTAEQQEQGRVLAAIDALRASPSEPQVRLALAEKLASQDAKTPAALEARDACAKAYRLLAESSQAQTSAEKNFKGSDKDSALATLTSLGEAQKKLEEANQTMNECSTASTNLRLRK